MIQEHWKKLQYNGYSFCYIFLRCFSWIAVWQWPGQCVRKGSEWRYLKLQSEGGQIGVSEKGVNGVTWSYSLTLARSLSEKGLNGVTWSYSLTVARSVCLRRGWLEIFEVTVWQWPDQCVWEGVDWRYLKLQSDSGQISVSEKGVNGDTWSLVGGCVKYIFHASAKTGMSINWTFCCTHISIHCGCNKRSLKWKSSYVLLYCILLSGNKIETPLIEKGYKGIHEISRGTWKFTLRSSDTLTARG